MPRIRPASRSGWKTSRASVFSPVPRNLTGTPVTAAIDSAAPPRASPSILVRMSPVTGHGRDERLGDGDGLLAGHRVDDEERLDRVDGGVDGGDLGHQRLVDRQPAGGVEDHDVADLAACRLDAAAGDVDDRTSRPAPGRPGMSSARRASRAGRRRPDGTGRRRRAAADGPACTTCRASLAAVVVLPEPWRPTSATTAGLPDRWNVRSPADRSATSSSLTILTTCWPAVRLSSTSCADGPLADPCDEVLDDLEVDVRLEQRQADLAHRGVDVGLADPAAAGQVAERLAQGAR